MEGRREGGREGGREGNKYKKEGMLDDQGIERRASNSKNIRRFAYAHNEPHTFPLPYLSWPVKGPAVALSVSATTMTPFPFPPTLFHPWTSARRAVEIVDISVSMSFLL